MAQNDDADTPWKHTVTKPILHYIHDPLCGWCYAAEPLVQAAVTSGVTVALHGGGLWGEPIHASAAKRRMMRSTDERISQITGQPFGQPYLDGLLLDPDTIWHSRPTIAAILAAQGIAPRSGLAMMAAIQRAHYVEGSRVVEQAVLVELARRIGLDPATFASSLDDVAVDRHIHETSVLMEEHDLHGFPTFLVERDGTLSRVHHESHYGRPADFVAALAG